MSAPRLVTGAASSAIGDVLRGPPRPVRVLAAFPAAVYLQHDDGLLALVAADGVVHPNAVVLGRLAAHQPLAGLHTATRGTVGEGRVVLGPLRVVVARWFDPVPRLRTIAPTALAAALADADEHLTARDGSAPHPLAAPTARLVDALGRGDEQLATAASAELIGAGPGLTPAGDDVLAGLLAAVATLAPALGVPSMAGPGGLVGAVGRRVVARARYATTAVSAALLAHAVRGEVAAPAGAVLHALAGRRPLRPALDDLLAVGATSGADLLAGLLAGARLVLADAAPHVPPRRDLAPGEPARRESARPATARREPAPRAPSTVGAS